MSTHPKTQIGSMKTSILYITPVIGLILLIAILILKYEGAEEITTTPTRGGQQTTQVLPRMQNFRAEAPVGERSEPIPALPRHCLDWSPAPPYSTKDFRVFVKGKEVKPGDIPDGGLINQGTYAEFVSNLEEPVPLNMIRYPMVKGKC